MSINRHKFRDNTKYNRHKDSHTRFHNIWCGMKTRCKPNTRAKAHLYKGIFVCDEWLVYENFKCDMHEAYLLHCKEHGIKNTTIDRKDNKKGYNKDNCRWATYSIQALNREETARKQRYKDSIQQADINTLYNNL